MLAPGQTPDPTNSQGPSRAVALLTEARGLVDRQRDEAVRLAREALGLARADSDLATAAEALNLLADADRMSGDMKSAQEKAQEALSTAEAAGDDRVQAAAINTLSALAWHKGEFDRAIELSTRALDLREKMGDERGIASTCGNLSLLCTEKGDLVRAMQFQQRCLALREKTGDRKGMGTAHLNLGVLYADLGDWDKALESYFRALAEKEREGDLAHVALCYNNIGELYLYRGKLDRARFYLGQALKLVESAPSKWILAEVLGTLGDVAFAAGDLTEAQAYYERDRDICAETEEREELAETLRRMAELKLAQGDRSDSRWLLEEALGLCVTAGARKEEGNVRRVLAELHAASGDKNRALEFFRQSETIIRSLGRNYELGLVLLGMARAGLAIPDDARHALLTDARTIFNNLGIPARAAEAEALLGKPAEPVVPSDLVSGLAALACSGLGVAELARRSLALICGNLGLPGAALFLRDGRVFHEGEAEAGKEGVTFAVEAGGRRFGTLLLRGTPVNRQSPIASTRTAVELLALGLSQAGAGPASAAPAPPGKESRFPGVIGADTTLRAVFSTVAEVAPTKANVLILGESGTGKEIVARALHRLSDRRDKPFVAVNCAAIPETLLETELFGVERGTATGVSARIGRFEVADGGTLFLDEIGDMSLGLQAKMLRVLQERSFERVGGREPVSVDVRVVAATNRNLEQAMAEAKFRTDLYYRLNVIAVSLPPLRERKSDIPALTSHFVGRVSREYGKPVRGVTEDCLACLMKASWPGNVRELENVVERGVILARGEYVTVADLPPGLQSGAEPGLGWREARRQAEEAATATIEANAIINALESSGWVVKQAARKLGISRRQFYRLLDKHGIARPEDRSQN